MVNKEGRSPKKKAWSLIQALIIFFLIFCTISLWSRESLKAPGVFVLNTAGKFNHFKGTIEITGKGIKIECKKKIFRPYNDFDKPLSRKFFVPVRELGKVEFRKGTFFLYTGRSFYDRYRNYFIDIPIGVFSPGYYNVIVFCMEKKLAKITAADAPMIRQMLKPVIVEIL